MSLALVLPAVSGASASRATKLQSAGLVYGVYPASSGVTHVWSATTNGRDRHDLGNGLVPLLSPNGRYVLATKATGSGLILFRAGGGVASALKPIAKLEATVLAWSPNSRYVALSWTSFKNGHNESGLDVVSLPTGKIVARLSGTINGASFAPTSPTRLVLAKASSELLKAKDTLEVLSDKGGHWRITQTLIRKKLVEFPLWGRYGIVYDHVTLRGASEEAAYQLFLLRHGHSTQITHTTVPDLVSGLVAIACSKNGEKLIANFVGTDTDEAYTVNLVTHQSAQVVVPGQYVTGFGISPNGSELLIDYGAFEAPADKGRVATIPFSGGTAKVIVKGGVYPSWRS